MQPRIVTRGHADAIDGTRIYFQQEAGVLDVRESIGLVLALLQSGSGSACRDCYQGLPEAWRTLSEDCREHRRHGVHVDPEEVTP